MHATIGVVSDTHGLLRPEACERLKGCDLIIHAGDICGQEIIHGLQSIQRTVFVLGNMDWNYPGTGIQHTEAVDFAGKRFYVLHDLGLLHLVPPAADINAVIHGHTHRPDIIRRDGVLYLNPGSIGPRRRDRPVSMALIRIANGVMHPEIIVLEE